MQTLVWTNIVVLGAATAVLYAIMRELGSRVSATLGAIMFLAIFGTGHLMYWGNFNFITPYSHEMTHGFTIALSGSIVSCVTRDQTMSVGSWAWV